ncbi:SCO family protein, partial [Arthrospira platensis SPKY1]|nr:SCO family protein [Arthrospira platensis SPKY1]
MFDQQGRVFTHENLMGHYTILNFIFTRCAVPTMCPLSTRKMRETQQLVATLGLPNVQFVSMTLDAEFDTPGVFKAYALDQDLDEANFFLLGGPVNVLRHLRNQMGVLAEEDPQ